jgi:uncharacterized membrane-anchored protein
MKRQIAALAGCLLLLAVWNLHNPARAQEQGGQSISWQTGPDTGRLGSVAQIRIPEGYRFTGRDGARTFMEVTQNPVSGDELGVLLPPEDSDSDWFVVFEFDNVGFVKDDEKNDLDGSAILDSIKRGTEAANKERRKRGWTELNILGWHTAPRYDSVTNNLTWAIRASSDNGESVNYSVRLLGRRGVMDVDLVLSPDQMTTTVPAFNELLTGFEFTTGNRYAEFVKGDKVAAYGLTALVAGGVGAAAAKSGLLGKLWKVLVFGVIAVGAALKRFIAGLFGAKQEAEQASPSQ